VVILIASIQQQEAGKVLPLDEKKKVLDLVKGKNCMPRLPSVIVAVILLSMKL
jgi:hypothetical protein